MSYRLVRHAGTLRSTATTRDARTGEPVPVEVREHEGAGVVTWALVDGEWRVVGAVMP